MALRPTYRRGSNFSFKLNEHLIANFAPHYGLSHQKLPTRVLASASRKLANINDDDESKCKCEMIVDISDRQSEERSSV